MKAYPLTWPDGFPRAKQHQDDHFKASLPAALKNVEDSLRRFSVDSGKKIENVVISSNVTLGVQRPQDPGVAVWFSWDALQVCIPVDRYRKVEANLQAIHHILEARRTELRHGGLAIVRATFTGFKALPDPGKRGWREVFNLGDDERASIDEVRFRYRRMAATAHPDRGGSDDDMATLNLAMKQAEEALGA